MDSPPKLQLNRIELRHLRYFVTVAESRSISAAAEKLHLSQPPLSVQIKELESVLGTQLLERHRSGISLTEAGRVMLEEARAVLERTERAAQHVQQFGRGELGEVRIALLGSVMWSDFPGRLAEFQRRYPRASWTLTELNQATQAADLLGHRIDVGLWRGDGRTEDGLIAYKMFSDQLMAVLPSSHAMARQAQVDVGELAATTPYLTMDPQLSAYPQELLDAMRSYGYTPRVAQIVRDPQTLLVLAGHGMGFALLAGSLQRVAWPGVVFRPLVQHMQAVDVYVHLRDQAPSPVISRFLEVLLERDEGFL